MSDVTLDDLLKVKADLLAAMNAEKHSTIELGTNAKGDVVWTVKSRGEDVNWAAFEAQQIHEALAARYGRGAAVNEKVGLLAKPETPPVPPVRLPSELAHEVQVYDPSVGDPFAA